MLSLRQALVRLSYRLCVYLVNCISGFFLILNEVGRCVGGLRQFGRGQKITFLAGYFRGAWSLQKLVSHDSWKYPAKKLFFGPCQNVSTRRHTFLAPVKKKKNKK